MGTPLVGRSENQGVAHRGDIGAVLDQAKEPVAIGGVAVHHRADQLVAFNHQPLVDPARRIAEHDILASRRIGKITGAEQVAAGHLQLGRGLHRTKGAVLPQQSLRQNPRLIVQRGDKAKELLVMFDTFANGPDRRIAGLHHVIDRDAAPHVQMGISGKAHFGPDADRHADDISVINGAIVQQHGLDPVLAKDGFGGPLAVDFHPPRFKRFLQQISCRRIQLTFHQMAHDVDDDHLHAAQLHAGGGFQPQQTTADHHRLGPRSGRRDHGIGIFKVAVGHDARQILALHWDDEGRGSGGNDQLVIGRFHPATGDGLGSAVDLGHRLAQHGFHPPRGIPSLIMRDNLGIGFLARQHRRQHDPVVIPARFGVEQRDVERVRRLFGQMLQHPPRGHARPDDNQFLFHQATSFFCWPCSYSSRKARTSAR